jgi:hypothetical protein
MFRSYYSVGSVLAATLVFGLTILGCEGEVPESSSPSQAANWYRGNLHTHSLWSDGDEYPEVIAGWYKQHGYDFLALSDHNILSRGEKWINVRESRGGLEAFRAYREQFGEEWVETREENGELSVRLKTLEEFRGRFEEPGDFLMIQSEEISDAYEDKPVHLNATNIQELIEPQGGESVHEVLQNNIDAVLEQRRQTDRPMFPHINHPNFYYAVKPADMIPLEGERFFEVYNGHPAVHNEGDDEHPSTERIWDIVLTKRLEQDRPVMYGLAVDDAHNYHTYDSEHSNPGRGWVMVRATELAPEAIVRAMQAGEFYSTSGVDLREISRDGATIRLSVRPEEAVSYTIQFIGTREGYSAGRSSDATAPGDDSPPSYSEEIGLVLKEVEDSSASYTMTGDEMYVRATVYSSKEKENPYRAGEVERAWIQPFTP